MCKEANIIIPESIYISEDMSCTIDTDFEDALKRESEIEDSTAKKITLKAFDEKGNTIPFALEETDMVLEVKD